MLQRDIHIEFSGNPQCGKEILCRMGVGLQRDFLFQHRNQCLHLHVQIRTLFRIVSCGLLFFQILFCLCQGLTQVKCRCHPACGKLTVPVLRIFTEGTLHADGFFYNHIVDAIAPGFHRSKGAAQHVGASRSGADCGYTAQCCRTHAFIHGIDSIDGPQLRRHDIVLFVIVHLHLSGAMAVQTGMTVCFHETRIHFQTGCVDDFCPFRNFQIRADGDDFSGQFRLVPGHQNVRHVSFPVYCIIDKSVFNTNHFISSHLIPTAAVCHAAYRC